MAAVTLAAAARPVQSARGEVSAPGGRWHHGAMRTVAAVVLGLLTLSCGSGRVGSGADGGSGAPGGDGAPGDGGAAGVDAAAGPAADAGPAQAGVRARARALAMHLRGAPTFMVGVGNDNSGPTTRPSRSISTTRTWSATATAAAGRPGTPTGKYPLLFAQTAAAHGVTPMFTYYQLALELEQGNDAVLADPTRMRQYLADVRLLFQRSRPRPAGRRRSQFEPDFFGYLMQRAATGTAPDALAAGPPRRRCPSARASPRPRPD